MEMNIDVQLFQIKVHRLGQPYTDCTEREILYEDSTELPGYYVKHTYSEEAATAICKQEYILRYA